MDPRGRAMIRRLSRPFAIVGLALALVGAVGAIALRLVDPVPVVATEFGFTDLALVGFCWLGVTFATVGGLLVVKRPGNAVGWCMVVVGVGYSIGALMAALTYSLVADGPSASGQAAIAAWLTVLFTTLGGIMFCLAFIFPTGRGHTPAWDRALKFFLVFGPLFLLMIVIQPGKLHVWKAIDNPFPFGPDFRTIIGMQISPIAAASSIVFVPFSIWAVVSRYRAADAIGRQQLKWFILALAITMISLSFAGFGAFVTSNPPEIGLATFGFAGSLVPIAIGIAILRYGLYDIDRLISRTLIYGSVTLVLAAIFWASAVGLSALLGSLAGKDNTLAVAGATLIVVTLFGPLRSRAHAIVDRRFDRAGYDAARTIRALTDRLREDVDIDRVESDVVDVVARTFRPSTSALWLRARPSRSPVADRPGPDAPVTIPGRGPRTVTTT